MNSTEHIHRPAKTMNRLMKRPLLSALIVLALAHEAWSADALYQNDAVVNYPGNVANPPVIDATNFVNTGTFIINFTAGFGLNAPFYETLDTQNYLNTGPGLMMGNTGFIFDNQNGDTQSRSRSASFLNQGTISCGSTNNTGDPFLGFLTLIGYYPQCLVNATNISNPGKIEVGSNGKIQFAGSSVDLAHGLFNMEGAGAAGNAFGVGTFGLNTNAWFPFFSLTETTAQSSYPIYLTLTNSTSFFDFAQPGPSNNIIRTVFIQDTSSSNVTYKVYFDTAGQGFGSGNVTIEWAGAYLDSATGEMATNYLYLNNNYLAGISTNVFISANGVPGNFTFSESSTPVLAQTPTPAGFTNVFSFNIVTNRYSYVSAQLLSSTADTNSVPNHSITNLPGRMEISADQDLDLAFAQITGFNYLSLQSPNQFNGSAGALIQAPYSDINVGVTNGFLTISNLMAQSIPNWSGTIQAWNTAWVEVDANGVTNDYRVLIVGSQLNPITAAQVQNLILHGTNSIVISDAFNIMRSFSADAQNLTLTTNTVGVGATSLEGEINVGSSASVFWSSAVPNLRNLTNNGAIRLQNLAQFAGSSNILAVTPASPAVAATGILTEVSGRTNVLAGNKVIIGTNQYVFVGKLTNSIPNQVKLATKFDGSMSNLIAAINGGTGAGTAYSSSTVSNPVVAAGVLTTNLLATNHLFTVTARIAGAAGNTIATLKSVSTTNLTWSGTTLAGGADAVAASTNITSTVLSPYANFINNGIVSDNSSVVMANNFFSTGSFDSGAGSFSLQSLTTTLQGGSLLAGGDISITADTLVTSNLLLQGHSLTLRVTNVLTDTGATDTNGNFWTVGSTNGVGGSGFALLNRPAFADLLGTTITNYAPAPNQIVNNLWSGGDVGATPAGYSNNAALGRLILDPIGANSGFTFGGTGISNALYVDYLELHDQATNFNSANIPALSIKTNLVIYYAQAVANGVSVAEKLNGFNNNRLRWVPGYLGHFSSTQVVYPDGTANTLNAALASSSNIDSDGDGIDNAHDASPVFVSSQVAFTLTLTNLPAVTARLTWHSIPGSTNYLSYTTNLASSVWLSILTNVSPSAVPPAGGWPITNTVDYLLNPVQPAFYRVRVDPAN